MGKEPCRGVLDKLLYILRTVKAHNIAVGTLAEHDRAEEAGMRAEREVHLVLAVVDNVEALIHGISVHVELDNKSEAVGEYTSGLLIVAEHEGDGGRGLFYSLKLRILGKAMHRKRIFLALDDHTAVCYSAACGEKKKRMRGPCLGSRLPHIFTLCLLGIKGLELCTLGRYGCSYLAVCYSMYHIAVSPFSNFWKDGVSSLLL